MKFPAFWLLLSIPFVLPAQDVPNPATADLFRDQLNRVNPNPVRDVSDPAARSREAQRLPLNADPNLSLSELQASQTALIRLNDRMNADAERAAMSNPSPELPAVGLLPVRPVTARPLGTRPQPRVPAPAAPPLAKPALPAGHTQNFALAKPTRQSSLRYFASRGGVDGRITGTFGFHTGLEPQPWWDVDLQQTAKIVEVRVYNSKISPEHARTLQVLLSDDGVKWNRVYAHNGSVFGGDGQPLRIPLDSAPARWVRLQLAEANFLHLDEIEVY